MIPQGKGLCSGPTSTHHSSQEETGQHASQPHPALPDGAQLASVLTPTILSFSASLEVRERIQDPMEHRAITEAPPVPCVILTTP